MIEDDFWCVADFESPESTQKMKKFEQILNLLRQEFKRLIRENKKLKDSLVENLPGHDSTSPTKANCSNNRSQTASKFDLKSRKVNDDILVKEDNNSPEKISISNPQTSTKIKKTVVENEIPEILSVEFNSDSEQSLLEQFERSKSSSISSEHQLQKSPVISRKRMKQKKSQSPRVDFPPYEVSPSSAREISKIIKEEPVIESQRFVAEDIKLLHTTKSLFTSSKEKENQKFVSPQQKPCSKLGLTKLYNVNTKLLSNGKKLKQTRLEFTAEQEKTDISTVNFCNEDANGTCDSIFDLSIFKKNADVENMDIEMEDQFPDRKSSPNVQKNTLSPKKSQVLDVDDFVEISPSALNSCIEKSKRLKSKKTFVLPKKSSKISKSPKKNIVVLSKVPISRGNAISFVPQACSTQISLPKTAEKCDVEIIQYLSSDSDTDFSFDAKHASKKQSPEQKRKTILADVSNTPSPQKSKSDKREDHQNHGNQVPITETVLEDETFFSPGEYRRAAGVEDIAKPSTSRQVNAVSPKTKRDLMSSFDRVPESRKRSPEYAYAVQSVRRKCERVELNGWSCYDCKKYYENLKLSEEELRECMKHCSRHKSKYDPEYHTPPDFWNPVFSNTLPSTLPHLEK